MFEEAAVHGDEILAAAFYERWPARTTAAAALVQAQQVLRAQTTDPFLWAPHALFGDWN